MQNETIAAVSTPYSSGGIGIIRISGNESAKIAKKIFTGTIDTSHTIRYGFVYDPETDERIDEVLVTYMKAPHSYTKEDIVEINCHSGTAVLNKVLELTLKNGARLAQNGEFTKRAFLNGRIDLTKAEAVIDVINAKTDNLRQNAVNQLTGSLFSKIRSYMDTILLQLANIEVSIDYPEHTDDVLQTNELTKAIEGLIKDALELYESADTGRILKEGINTVIAGSTNVGKSSLLNYFAGCDRAIVTDIHGTTRDMLEESINLDGILLKLIDTAGIRYTNDVIEKIGIDRAKQAVLEADLVLAVFDGSRLQTDTLNLETNAVNLALINKCDLDIKIDKLTIENTFGKENTFSISLKNETGLTEVTKRIKELFYKGEIKESCVITNARHKEALLRCIDNLKQSAASLNEFPADIAAINLTEAYRNLCEITGDDVSENLIDKIFSEFCLGK